MYKLFLYINKKNYHSITISKEIKTRHLKEIFHEVEKAR